MFAQFDFLLRWPDLTDEEKDEKYSEFSSHELNFFIYQKVGISGAVIFDYVVVCPCGA